MAVASPMSFIECPQCHGFGYTLTTTGTMVTCSLCQGKQSVIGFIGNDLVYWGLPLTAKTIFERKPNTQQPK